MDYLENDLSLISESHNVDFVDAARRLEEPDPVTMSHFLFFHFLYLVYAPEPVPHLCGREKTMKGD